MPAIGRARAAVPGALLLLVLLLMIPPTGYLGENEENYFALAYRFVAGTKWPDTTAIFDRSLHRFLSDTTLGVLVATIGYAATQIVTRLLAVVGYAVVLTALFRVYALSAFEAAAAAMVLTFTGQDIAGGEWLFGGYEAKIAAYIFVLAGLRQVLISDRLTTAVGLFAIATYFHFLVGGFWFAAAMALRVLTRRDGFRPVVAAVFLFACLAAPLVGLIAFPRLTDFSAAQATDVPPPDVIYSIIREPHHQSPFLTWDYFRTQWLPGYLWTVPMLLIAAWVARAGRDARLRALGLWLAGLLTYFIVILGPKFLDRDTGILGKFYLFRPSSLILFLWLMFSLAVVMRWLGERRWLLRAALAVTLLPAFLVVQGGRVIEDIAARRGVEAPKRQFAEMVSRVTRQDDVLLIDPDLEMAWLDFERRVGRPNFVLWKYAPTNDADLITWYRRILLRRAVFEQGCDAAAASGVRIDFLLSTPDHARRLAGRCGSVVGRVGDWNLIAR